MREVPGFPGYYASEEGSIWSMRSGSKRLIQPRLKHGYWYVTISVYVGGKRQRHRHPAHRLVCMAFHGLPPDDKPLACHRNGIRTDSRPCNLRWGDHADNAADAIRHGTLGPGMLARRRKLTDEQVAEIRNRLRSGERDKDLADEYGVSRYYPTQLLEGRNWGHLRP